MIYQPTGSNMDAVVVGAFIAAITTAIVLFVIDVVNMIKNKRKREEESRKYFKNL